MERKRTLTDYSDDELLKALEQYPSSEQSTREFETDVPLFLAFYKIKSGKDLINKKLLYRLYSLWSSNPLEQTLFTKEMHQYFKPHVKGAHQFFYINRKSLDISEEVYNFILAKSQPRTKIPAYKEHFDKFLNYYKIKPGSLFLETYILFDLYRTFVRKTRKKAPLGYKQFYNFCRLYFKKERMTQSRVGFFGVDKSIFEFITMKQIRQLRKKHHGKKVNETIKREVPSASSTSESQD